MAILSDHAPMRFLPAVLLILVLGATACAAPPDSPVMGTGQPVSTPSVQPPPELRGTLVDAVTGSPLPNTAVALCRFGDQPGGCMPELDAATTDLQGGFVFTPVVPGDYALLVETGLSDFAAGLGAWQGRVMYPGDPEWLLGIFLDGDDLARVHLPLESSADRVEFAARTLLVGQSPFSVAVDAGSQQATAVITVEASAADEVRAAVYLPAGETLDDIREAVGALSREEVPLFDPELASRWGAFAGGSDPAFRESDALAITAVRRGDLYRIGNTFFMPVTSLDGVFARQTGYGVIDTGSGKTELAAVYDPETGDVIETATGYRLNVRDNPGVWLAEGEAGEQFYHYGFSYYRAWHQVLPDPVITLIDNFYAQGKAFVVRDLNEFRTAAAVYANGDLSLLAWDDTIGEQMRLWRPATPPFVILPDSGAVDVRRERFLDAIIESRIKVDEDGLEIYLSSLAPAARPDPQDVRDALLTPYRNGHLFSDLEAAIILGATYSAGGNPLGVSISQRLRQGYQVPFRGDRVVRIAPAEVTQVIMPFPSSLNSHWGHELWHVVDFRAEQYIYFDKPAQGSRCEPVKYLLEFMWWVNRYPGDAPDADWLYLNSGLALARLLSDRYPNSGC